MLRSVLATIAGLIIGGTIVHFIEAAGHHLYPMPEGFDPNNMDDVTEDVAEKEARCTRASCCNDNYEYVESDVMQCWGNSYYSFEEDPCGCTVYFVEKQDTWSWHERHCQEAFSGQLMSLHTSAAAAAVAAYDTDSNSIYLGLHDYLVEDAWMNTDGTPANWLGWNTNEPNDSNGEDCAEVYPSTKKLNDIDCDYSYTGRTASACLTLKD